MNKHAKLMDVIAVAIIRLFITLGPEPAFGWLGLGGSLGGYSSHASLRAYGTQL